MSEELIQRNLINSPEKMGEWDFYNIGSTRLSELRSAHIIPDRSYKQFEGKKPDALIVKKQNVIAAIEYKTPKELNTQKQIMKAIAQELGTARALNANVYIVTDGTKTFWINPETAHPIKHDDGTDITLNFDRNDSQCVALINRIIASGKLKSDRIVAPIIVDPLPLAKKVWQDLWSVSGATPENCLYSFVEIFIFKYLSDLHVLTGVYSFGVLLDSYETNTDSEVLENYARSIRPKIKELFPAGPKDHTTIINGTIFVSKDEKAVEGYATVFHRILQRFKEFGTLKNIDRDFKGRLFETFLKESISKKNWGQYFTPLKVVRSIVDMVDISPGMVVCDPACGVGKFLLEPIAKDMHRYFDIKGDRVIPKITIEGFDKGFDREEQKTIILAKANMLIYMADLIRENPKLTASFANVFNAAFLLQTNSILGTLAHPISEKYDLILTNPPYVMSGSSNLKEEIAKDTTLKNYFSVSAMGIEGLFMEWIVRALKPGGKAFVVVPDGIFNRANDRKLREFILENCFIDAIISLPINTFFTTNKKTYILVIEKKIQSLVNGIRLLPKQDTPVFTYLCSEIGESRDSYRFDIPQNDLKNAVELFNMFKGAKASFRTTDGRCKLFVIDQFYQSQNWCVDRFWTQTEKIALCIEEESREVDVSGFRVLLSDAVASLSELDELLVGIEKKKTSRDVSYKKVSIKDIFYIKRGSGHLTKKYVKAHSGKYPVYSGNTQGAFAHIDKFGFDVPCLSWVIDGLAGYVMIHETPFSATNHRGVLIPRCQSGVNLRYLKSVIEPVFRANKKGRIGDGGMNEYTSLPPNMVADLEVQLPIKEDGNLDLDFQKEDATRLSVIEQVKGVIKDTGDKFSALQVIIQQGDFKVKQLVLSDLFEIKKGNAKYTKKYGVQNAGSYPVYSASSQTPLTHIDTYDYDGRFLSWSTNGFAGTMLILEGRFSLNGDRGILVPLGGRTDLDLDYMRYTIEPIFRSMAKGRKGDRGEDEFTKLYPSMISDIKIPVPVDDKGSISLGAQKEIATRYKTIEACKRSIIEKCNKLVSQEINVSV